MLNTDHPQVSYPRRGRTGEGTASMMAHLLRQHVRPDQPAYEFSRWADTCPGSYDGLWKEGRLAGDPDQCPEADANSAMPVAAPD
jgi:hypothetical protein